MPHTLTVLIVTPRGLERRRAPRVAEQPLVGAEHGRDAVRDRDADPDRDHDEHERRLAHDAPQDQAVHPRAGEREQDGGGEHGEPEREPDVDGQPRDRVGAEQQHRALREVDDAAGAVDHDEPERDERVGRAERDALEEQLEELGHAALPTACSSPRYARMTRSSAWISRGVPIAIGIAEVEHEDPVGDLA